jgi:hypothetical protein
MAASNGSSQAYLLRSRDCSGPQRISQCKTALATHAAPHLAPHMLLSPQLERVCLACSSSIEFVPGELPIHGPVKLLPVEFSVQFSIQQPHGAPPRLDFRQAQFPALPVSPSMASLLCPAGSCRCTASYRLSSPAQFSLASRRHHGCAADSHPHCSELFPINLEVYTFPRGVHSLYSDPVL